MRKACGVGAKGVDLALEAHDKGVRHGADDGNAVVFAGHDVTGAGEAGEITGARDFHAGVAAVGAAQREVDHRPAACGMNATGRFGGDHALQMNLIDDEGLDDLRLDNRRGDFEHRFVFKKNPPFGNRPNLAGEFEICQIVEKVIGEQFLCREIVESRVVEGKIFQIIENILKPGRDEIAAVGRIGADE